MKKNLRLLLLPGLACLLSTDSLQAQSTTIGNVDNDGNTTLTIDMPAARQLLWNLSLPTEAQPFSATEVLITDMADGTYSFTGYIKNPVGKVVRGFRVQCNQDDANSLIVQPGNKRERITGRPF